ncbi:MAG TPA: hypothetical protein VHD83_20710, partial [Puia sp.]|nr:hypothetical protein [Puia sp.]
IGCSMVLLLGSLTGCNEPGGTKNEQEFEGVITYKILYKNKDYSSLYGDTMKVYYSKGDIARVYNSQGPDAVRKDIFYGESHRYLIQRAASDTILTYDMVDQGGSTLVSTKRSSEDTRILGHICKKMEFDEVYQRGVKFNVYNSFLYSPEVLKVDKRHFKDWNFGHFNAYVNEAGVFYLKFETSYRVGDRDLITRTYTAVEIREQKIDSSVFHMDTTVTKPLVL